MANSKEEYQPQVTVKTEYLEAERQVRITVTDNGPGIPEDVKDKLFQPFFTTKVTGAGTGLGLGLSYDIITKGHGGSLRVDSINKGSSLIIEIPVSP